MNIFDTAPVKNAAHFVTSSPVGFVQRSAEVFVDLSAVVHAARRYTGSQTRERSARLCAALGSIGVGRGVTVTPLAAVASPHKETAK